MSESLNVLKTGRYEARVKGGMATDPPEADRQWEEWNLNKAQISLREAAGLNENKPIRSVVIRTSSNGVNERADPVLLWRRQHRAPTNPARMHGRSGVTGLACGEGYSGQDGRSCFSPVRGITCVAGLKSSKGSENHTCNSPEVNLPINGSEAADNGEQEVRQDHSRDETPAMGADSKDPDFCQRFLNSSGLSELPEREREGIEHEQ